MSDGGWGQAHARQKQAERDNARRLAADPAVAKRSRRFNDRFGAACKQTKGNVKAAMALVAEWEEAEERARNSPVRTLALAENGDPCEHEEDC